MQSGRYLFGIFFFLTFLTGLVIFLLPVGPGSSNISSYFTAPPNENIHYSEVPNGTNVNAYVIVDNTGINTYDVVNVSFKVAVLADIIILPDVLLNSSLWIQNFTVLAGQSKTIVLNFEAVYPDPIQTRELYVEVWWGDATPDAESVRLPGLRVGSDFVEPSFFNLQNTMIMLMSIAMGVTLLVLAIAARRDIKRHRHHPTPQTPHTPPTPPTPPSRPVPPTYLVPPSTASQVHSTDLLPTDTMELIPCPECGSKIDKSQIVCSNCGYELPKCVICNLVLDDDEAIETCPECGVTGHRAHFREWVHVKGKCPICKKTISFD